MTKNKKKDTNNISSTVISTPSNTHLVSYDPDAKDEVMPKHLFAGFANMVLNYVGGDINPSPKVDTKIEDTSNLIHQLRLFGKTFKNLMDPEATQVANLLLSGEKNDINIALDLIKKNPDTLRCHAMVYDHKKRCIKGTPLQIAAMAGDIDLKENIPEEDEDDHGLVRRLIKVGDLSKEEFKEQLKCITSEKAQLENNERNQRILSAIIKFGIAISNIKICEDMCLTVFQNHCRAEIEELEKDLQFIEKEIITSGFVFDSKILYQAAEWFRKNINLFDDWYSVRSDVFWINAWGMLQNRLSSRDLQLVKAGIVDLFTDGVIPARKVLMREDSCSYLFDASSSLGDDYCLGGMGTKLRWAIAITTEFNNDAMYSELSDIKVSLLKNLSNNQELDYKKVV